MADICKVAYRLQKVRKRLAQPEPDWAALKSELYGIRNEVSEITGGRNIALSLTLTIDKIDPAVADAQMAVLVRSWLADVLADVRSMKMKKRICRTRTGIAQQRYEHSLIGSPTELRQYDIILAPTEGGFHYSLVVRLDEEYVWCLPYTTCSARSLRVIGRRFAKVPCPVGDADRVYLTSACSRIGRAEAERHFVSRFEPSEEDLEQITQLLPRVWREGGEIA